MPILPLVDLLILLGSGSLVIGFLLKAVAIVTIYQPRILGFSSVDFVLITGVCFGLALTLVARTWLKLNEPGMLALRSRLNAEEAHRRVHESEAANHGHGENHGGGDASALPVAASLGSMESR